MVVEATVAVVPAKVPTTVAPAAPAAPTTVPVELPTDRVTVTGPTGEDGAVTGVVGEFAGTFGRDAGTFGADRTPTGAAGGAVGVAGTFVGVVTAEGVTGAVGGDTGIVGALGTKGVEIEGPGGVVLGTGSPAAAWPVATSAITAVATAMLSVRISAAEIPTFLNRAFLHEMGT